MPREPRSRRRQGNLFVGWPIALVLMAAAGCDLNADKASFRQWWTGGQPAQVSATGSSSVEAPEGHQGQEAGTSQATSQATRDQIEAATRAAKDAHKAEVAAEEAKKASEEAIQASKQASEAAAQVNNPQATPDLDAGGKGQVNPTASSAPPSPFVLSSTTESSEEAHQRLSETLDRLEQSLGRMERTKLDDDGVKRRDLASKLIQGARKALAQNDYSEANGLATKASVIMAPLTVTVPSARSNVQR